ncbi:MAG: hypothetical protein ACK47B_18225 [Armatimonadota bacterium]
MIVDPETREAFRGGGTDPRSSGPLFFTSRENADAYAREHGIAEYTAHEVPGSLLSRMKGKPHWLDGRPGS